MEVHLIEIPDHSRLSLIDREINSRDNVFMAVDVCRKQYLIVSQKLSCTSDAIQELCGEAAPISSLYECSNHLTRKGRIGSFSILKLPRTEATTWIDANRHRFQRLFISTTAPIRWKVNTFGKQDTRSRCDADATESITSQG